MNTDKKHQSWTIMVIGDQKQLGSYEVKRKTVTIAVIGIIGMILIIAGYIWFQNSSHLRLQKNLQEKLTASEQSIETVKQENEVMSQKLKEFEDALASASKKPAVEESEAPITSTDHFNKMSVENFEINLDKPSNSLRFKFLLRNLISYNNPVSGHVFVILKPQYLDASTWHCYPNTMLTNGKPQNVNSGESFTVARFKTIRGVFTAPPQQTGQYFVSIWVFSDNDELMMIKDFYIRNDQGKNNES